MHTDGSIDWDIEVFMKRRHLLKLSSASFLGTLSWGLASTWQTYQAQSSGTLTIQSLGHSCFLFTGSDRRILTNPFRPIGCTAGYQAPSATADVVLTSSQLFDEGYISQTYASTQRLTEPGVYDVKGVRFQGVGMPHDREGGRRFGTNVAWQWTQSGINIVHLGGAAAPISLEDQILLGRPDVLLVPVGGGPKAYGPEEAVAAIRTLEPKVVIPTQYRTAAADSATCDIDGVDPFLTAMTGASISRPGSQVTLRSADLPATGRRVVVLN
jgi:L-ascorbate metabolism protein UlaG (beta-lactamase superfamily)